MKAISNDAPLVAFTAAATAGAGILAARLLLGVLGAVDPMGDAGESWWAAGLVGGALVVSVFHLGRPERMSQALRGLLRSPVSNEVALASLYVAAVLARLAVGDDSGTAGIFHSLACLTGFGLLISLGLVYRLGGQRTWGGIAVLSPVTLGLGFGAVFLVGIHGLGRASVAYCLVLLGLDAALVSARAWKTLRIQGAFAPVHPRLFGWGPSLIALRLVLVNGIPVVALVSGRPLEALAFLAAGVAVDRIGFYGLAAQQTTESELLSVEEAIEARSRGGHGPGQAV
jgi:DMSO reductase anchor subunit